MRMAVIPSEARNLTLQWRIAGERNRARFLASLGMTAAGSSLNPESYFFFSERM